MSNILHVFVLKSVLLHPWSALASLLLLIFVTKWCFFTYTTRNKHFPPSPSKLPVIGNLHQIGLLPHRSLHSMAQRYGPIMLLRLGKVPTLVVSSADVAREIMKTHDIIFSNRPDSKIHRRLLYDYKDLSLAPYGEYWRQMRGICMLQLLSMKRVQSFRVIREEETQLMLKKIEESCECSSPVDLSEVIASLTNDIVCRVAFGRKYSEGEGGKKFKKLLEEFGELLGVFNVGDFIPWLGWLNYVTGLEARVEKVFREFDDFLDGIVDEHMEKKVGTIEDQKNFVDVLLEIQKDSKSGDSVGRDGIKAIILDMFAAGTDTTYTALEWAMTELLRHQEVMKLLQNEIRKIIGSKPNISEVDLEKMHYLKAVIKESFRLHPPVPLLIPRESTEDVKVQGYDILAKTRVIINAWAIGRDPKYWEEPQEFRPERFLSSSIDFKGQDFQLIPFGAGRRGCPGTSFANATIELALASLLHKFEWAVPSEGRGTILNVTEYPGITVRRKFPLVVVATPRSL
ncbi:hypothetical protein Patl1_18170 [Pistacia atlantica]|uniref:Uncharacterized protein n=1 Tax=Pistacia atlantica TaxID=434234 RepID=A0ACC1C2H0_9ROSI|nr:hypothetical protein Patl1_18170 [Pistacia atlantica]